MVEHMANTSAYIQSSRHHVYYFRIRVPLHLQTQLKQTYIRRSLQTKCRRQAVIRCSELLQQADTLFDCADSKVTDVDTIQWGYEKADKASGAVLSLSAEEPIRTIKAPSAPLLSAVLSEYFVTQRLEGVGERTIRAKLGVANLLYRIIGDVPVDEYSRAMMQTFKSTALKLPPRLNQLGGISIKDAIAQAKTTISVITFNNYVKDLSTVFTFAVRAGYCERNPFDGLKVKLKVKVSSLRSRFTNDDVDSIFSTEIHTHNEKTPKDYQYWLPLLGLYTGARLNELSQLYRSDIVVVNDIDCLHIQAVNSGQRLKSPSSERLIPIHSKLKALGFLDFVTSFKKKSKLRLFPELSYHKYHGYSATPSKWFARHRVLTGLSKSAEKKDFHSFRHTLADDLKQRGVAESLIAGILGHSTGGITFGRYGKDYTPEVLAPIIDMLDWDLPQVSSYQY